MLLFGYCWTVLEEVEEVVASLQGLLVRIGVGDELNGDDDVDQLNISQVEPSELQQYH